MPQMAPAMVLIHWPLHTCHLTPLAILLGRHSCHVPSLSSCLRSYLSLDCGVGLRCLLVRPGPLPEALGLVFAQTRAV